MFGYYLRLAVRSLRRAPILTTLMITAIGLGIGGSMTVLTVFRAMSGDPIPDKSSQLFVPQIDPWGHGHGFGNEPPDQLTYLDVEQLLRQHLARRQSAMYGVGFSVIPRDASQPAFDVDGRAVNADFFPMFEVPFRYGAPWTADDDRRGADVVVIGQRLNDRLFQGANSVGRSIDLDNHTYQIAGVLDDWQPVPRFYAVAFGAGAFEDTDDVFLPFTRAIDSHMAWQNINCNKPPESSWEGHMQSDCVWLGFWVELPTEADVQHYRSFLDHYAADQHRSGRFQNPPNNRLRNVREWLDAEHVVSNEATIMMLVAFGLLVVCLINAAALILAKFMGRAGEFGVRRALGASRRAIFSQCLVETAVIGVVGSVAGLGFTLLGLVGLRATLTTTIEKLAYLDVADVLIAIVLALAATVVTGLYPTWRAAQVQPAWQLKTN
ncbi:ABC transporter permease [Rhodanobacter sp. C05]|uniref:ABC transporter permease n=1 Tax=Rhodanobacter sp. C05 TaxID=1945855 RepID=UPI000984BE75|nr:ABC transporter permease [Rhodanobacter sp. C05]OOG41346.1 peptide ABC transporter permease [Rhodanobacter sp. C05]